MILETDLPGYILGAILLVALGSGFVGGLRWLRAGKRIEHEGIVYFLRRNDRIEDAEGRIVEDPTLRAQLVAKGASFGDQFVFPTGHFEVVHGLNSRDLKFRIRPEGGGGHEDEEVDRVRAEQRD